MNVIAIMVVADGLDLGDIRQLHRYLLLSLAVARDRVNLTMYPMGSLAGSQMSALVKFQMRGPFMGKPTGNSLTSPAPIMLDWPAKAMR